MSAPREARPDAQFQALVRERYAGNPRAMMALGARLVVGRDAPLAPVDGAALIDEAARQHDAEAWACLAVLAAAGVGRPQSWSDAYGALERAAELGEAKAAQQLRVLRDAGLGEPSAARAWLAQASGQTLCEAPALIAYRGFLDPRLCAYLIERAAPRLARARVYDARAGSLKVDAMRTNRCAPFSLIDTDLVMQLVRARIAHAAAVAAQTLEPLEVLQYAPGERYRAHVDFFHPALPDFAQQMRLKGQRVKTCLVYLNHDYDGGETSFPRIARRFRGGVGEALIFDNVRADGSGDMNTLHEGLPPTRGEKWLLSQWIRDKPQAVA